MATTSRREVRVTSTLLELWRAAILLRRVVGLGVAVVRPREQAADVV